MMTQSPMSAPGVKMGLCLPRRSLATSDAIRPRRMPSASTTNHFLFSMAMSEALGIHVFCLGIRPRPSFAAPSSITTAAAAAERADHAHRLSQITNHSHLPPCGAAGNHERGLDDSLLSSVHEVA